jgi:Protein of unknown function (DUF2786)
MTPDERPALLERIRKLQDRAKRDPRSAEGRTAASLARTLMQTHGITERELRPAAPERTIPPARTDGRRRPPRAPVPVSLDLDLGGIKIHWEKRL